MCEEERIVCNKLLVHYRLAIVLSFFKLLSKSILCIVFFYHFISPLPTPPRVCSPLYPPTFTFFLSFNTTPTKPNQDKQNPNKTKIPDQIKKPTKKQGSIFVLVSSSSPWALTWNLVVRPSTLHFPFFSRCQLQTEVSTFLCPLLLSAGTLCGLNL